MKDLIAHGISITNKRPELLGQINDRIKQCQERSEQKPESENHEKEMCYIDLNRIRDTTPEMIKRQHQLKNDDAGGTGHGDISMSDADSGL